MVKASTWKDKFFDSKYGVMQTIFQIIQSNKKCLVIEGDGDTFIYKKLFDGLIVKGNGKKRVYKIQDILNKSMPNKIKTTRFIVDRDYDDIQKISERKC